MTFHFIPINDTKSHINRLNCDCNPKAEIIYSGNIVSWLIFHKSYDGREDYEDYNENWLVTDEKNMEFV